MAYNEWSLSTPSNHSNNANDRSILCTASTISTNSIGSILRSSSAYTASKLNSSLTNPSNITCKKKRVRIVSPIKWEIDNKSSKSLKSKREFINTTISFCEIKRILRDLDCDSRGCYDECVDRLLSTNWIPNRKHIECNERLRAKPIHACNERVIKLENGTIDYLQRFTINELKKWLKYHNIDQPSGASKLEYMKLINIHFLWRSPSPDSFRFKIRPNRPCHDKTKTMSRTPRTDHRMNKNNHMFIDTDNKKSRLDFDEYDSEHDSIENIENIENNDDNMNDIRMEMEIDNNYDEGLRMQLCFDD